MKCLNCGAELTNYHVRTPRQEVSYNLCDQCGSLWLDAGELDKVALQVAGDIEYCSQELAAGAEIQIRKCPRCDDSDLDRVKFLGCDDIVLHRCGNCGGFWLDGGELKMMDQKLAKTMPVKGRGFSDFVNNVHVPYWCKRIRRKSSEVDFHVEVPPITGATRQGSTTDTCPACGQALDAYKAFSMPFEGCPKCKGVWLGRDELRRLKNRIDGGSLRWLNDEIESIEKTSVVATQRPCVKCKTAKMVSVIFGKSSILIDWCPQCHGMWLDRGEFASIIEYLKTELHSMRSKDIEKKALEEAKRIWNGGPESRIEEALDAEAAFSALINATIFEHPALLALCMSLPRA